MNDERDIIGTKPKSAPVDLGPLFASGSDLQPGSDVANTGEHFGSSDRTARREQPAHTKPPGYPFDTGADAARKAFVKRAVDRIAPELRTLARMRGRRGVTCIDTREIARKAGVITGEEAGRSLSWFSLVPVRAGLVSAGPDDEWTGTGNRPTRYLHPDFAWKEGAA